MIYRSALLQLKAKKNNLEKNIAEIHERMNTLDRAQKQIGGENVTKDSLEEQLEKLDAQIGVCEKEKTEENASWSNFFPGKKFQLGVSMKANCENVKHSIGFLRTVQLDSLNRSPILNYCLVDFSFCTWKHFIVTILPLLA